jgi:UDP-N-acetyl-D-galactosamine dehydrogenase
MGQYVAENAVKQLVKMGRDVSKSKVAILGFTFKEDCPDTRNTRVIDVVRELESYGLTPIVVDPVADAQEAMTHYGVSLSHIDDVHNADCLIVAVQHKEFIDLNLESILTPGGLLIDVKGIFKPDTIKNKGYNYYISYTLTNKPK